MSYFSSNLVLTLGRGADGTPSLKSRSRKILKEFSERA
jgi:hypothetical protein